MPPFKLTYQTVELQLKQAFGISRGTKKTVRNVIIKLSAAGIDGYGEAAPNSRYNEDADNVIHFFKSLPPHFFKDIETSSELAYNLEQLNTKKTIKSGKSALVMAWWDWWGKSRQRPLWALWDTPLQTTPLTSFTIGLDKIDIMQQKVEQAAVFPLLKIKLGTDHDREIIKAIRAITDKPIRIDANEGWKTMDRAKSMIGFLADHNIEMIEQPMPVDSYTELIELKKYSPLPVCADESFTGDESLSQIARAFDIINIKLSKIGSLTKARRVISRAKEHELKVMIGCMIESSLAISAGALLGTRVDYVDLDGHLLIEDDPFEGLSLTKEKSIRLSENAGLGVKLRDDSFF